ncbi:MAG: hypothetical protein LBE92_09615 [Chryseobacterium sp.]|jgi:predicted metal-dependent HD superfamily phosphohydrolase|uniref:HD domain-containing protein n=1 Tax=Chryseobacterium sp. TaxID=1871047 RepID=UPI00282B0963|nr:hypothetical protein [Chryseobacterium sp.]MDR2236370.1 hypothetical protein [Chryseobacterium sp.]
MDLKAIFEKLCHSFTEDPNLITLLWQEIEARYSEKGRYYHTLVHLEQMIHELESVKDHLSDFNGVLFSVFYHDVIYDAFSQSNEEKSAAYAVPRLEKLGLSPDRVSKIHDQIIATKAHQQSEDHDTNYLLDADLSVLGKDWQTYLDYSQKIRKEYAIYPDFLYKPGRKKVLKHFLEFKNIFKTEVFRSRYEMQAGINLKAELEIL